MTKTIHPHTGKSQLSSLLILAPKNRVSELDTVSQFLRESQEHMALSGDIYASHNIDHTLYGAPQYQ